MKKFLSNEPAPGYQSPCEQIHEFDPRGNGKPRRPCFLVSAHTLPQNDKGRGLLSVGCWGRQVRVPVTLRFQTLKQARPVGKPAGLKGAGSPCTVASARHVSPQWPTREISAPCHSFKTHTSAPRNASPLWSNSLLPEESCLSVSPRIASFSCHSTGQ